MRVRRSVVHSMPEIVKMVVRHLRDAICAHFGQLWKQFGHICDNFWDHTLTHGYARLRVPQARKIWQLTQSSATKARNLEIDFTEAASKASELGWSEGKNNSKCWLDKNDGNDSTNKSGQCQKSEYVKVSASYRGRHFRILARNNKVLLWCFLGDPEWGKLMPRVRFLEFQSASRRQECG